MAIPQASSFPWRYGSGYVEQMGDSTPIWCYQLAIVQYEIIESREELSNFLTRGFAQCGIIESREEPSNLLSAELSNLWQLCFKVLNIFGVYV